MAGYLDSDLEGFYPVQDALESYRTTKSSAGNFLGPSQHGLSPAQPTTLLCEAEVGQGRQCGAEAKVRCVHYRYTARLDRRLGEVQQVLSEAIYEIACPRCGWRTQVQKVEWN
ncbi:MAG TPA: hypothetical protein VF175_04975 [Lacipirellula sp.]